MSKPPDSQEVNAAPSNPASGRPNPTSPNAEPAPSEPPTRIENLLAEGIQRIRGFIAEKPKREQHRRFVDASRDWANTAEAALAPGQRVKGAEEVNADALAKTNLDRHHLEAMIRVGMESTDEHVRGYAAQTGKDVDYVLEGMQAATDPRDAKLDEQSRTISRLEGELREAKGLIHP
jgi:hypothetical protein